MGLTPVTTTIAPAASLPELEVWWKANPDRWPYAPKGHYIGPDGRLLSPGEFAAYAAGPSRLVVVVDAERTLRATAPR